MKRPFLALASVLAAAACLASVAAASKTTASTSCGDVSSAWLRLENGKATVSFTVEGCARELSLVSYKAPGPTWDPSTGAQQQYFQSVTDTLGPGSYQWSVDIPNCYYQADFVYGTPIMQGSPEYSVNLIRSLNGGTTSCNAPPAQVVGNQSNNTSNNTPNTPNNVTTVHAATVVAAPVAPPSVSLVKLERIGTSGDFAPGPLTAPVGSTVYYEMIATNTGTTTISVNLTDDGCDSGTVGPLGPQAILPGASLTFTCSHTLIAADGTQYVNTALVTANNAGPTPATATASATTTIAAPAAPVTGGVAGAGKTITHRAKHAKVAHAKVKKVVKRAKPARAVIRSAHFTG